MENFLGQLALVSFPFPPKNWALCNGQLMTINQNQALFSLVGTTFGGNGTTTFGLPDLRSRVAMGVGTSPSGTWPLGKFSGSETVALTVGQIPTHIHTLAVSSQTGGTLQTTPVGNTVGGGPDDPFSSSSNATLAPGAISTAGAGQGHENRSPYLTLNWIIALTGIFPTRN